MPEQLPALGELQEKQDRLTRAAQAAGLADRVLATHHNIAWLTGGRSNRVDASREAGTARLLVTAEGRSYVLANEIEMPRLLDEAFAGCDEWTIAPPVQRRSTLDFSPRVVSSSRILGRADAVRSQELRAL